MNEQEFNLLVLRLFDIAGEWEYKGNDKMGNFAARAKAMVEINAAFVEAKRKGEMTCSSK